MPIMFSLREETQNASELKANKPTIIPSKISSAYECNKTIALLPRFELAQIFEHEWTNNTLTKSHSTKMRLFYASRISSNHELHDDNRQTQSNAHFLMPKISFSDLKLEDTPSEFQPWAVWLIITKFIKQKWTLQECFSKYPKQVTTRPRSTTKLR